MFHSDAALSHLLTLRAASRCFLKLPHPRPLGGTSARPVHRVSSPPNERPLSGRPKTTVGVGPSAAVQAATAAMAASAALSRNPIFLEFVPVRVINGGEFSQYFADTRRSVLSSSSSSRISSSLR
jgi:hypothetical protein